MLTQFVYIFNSFIKFYSLNASLDIILLVERLLVLAERNTLLGERSKKQSFSEYGLLKALFVNQKAVFSKFVPKTPEKLEIHQI